MAMTVKKHKGSLNCKGNANNNDKEEKVVQLVLALTTVPREFFALIKVIDCRSAPVTDEERVIVLSLSGWLNIAKERLSQEEHQADK